MLLFESGFTISIIKMKGFRWIKVMRYSLPWFNLELMQVPKES
jgi:hypothetical protein